MRSPLEALASSSASPKLAAWLFSFGLVLVLGADDGGYFPTTWGWGSLVLLFLCALVLALWLDVRLSAFEATTFVALLAFLGWGLASVLWSPSSTQPVLQSQRTLLYAAGLFAAFLIARRRSYRALLGGVWLAIALLSVYSLVTRLFPERIGFVDDLAGYRLAQPLGYWNALGIFAAMGTLLAFGFAARSRSTAVRALAAASTLVLVPTLYFTFSRGAWIALGAGLVAAVVFDARRLQLVTVLLVVGPWPALAVWRASGSEPLTHLGSGVAAASHAGHRFTLLLVGLAAAAAAATLVYAALERRIRAPQAVRVLYAGALLLCIAAAVAVVVVRVGSPPTIARRVYRDFIGPSHTIANGNLNQRLFDLSAGQRIPQWKVAWREYELHPLLGSGEGTYERYWNQYRPYEFKVRNVHNLYLETLAELGPIGLGLLALALGLPLMAAFWVRRRALASVAIGAYVAFLVHAAVDWDWQMPAVTFAALVCAAALLVCTRRDGARAVPARPVWRVAALALTVALAAFAFVGLRGNRAIAASQSAANKANWAQSASDARRATRWAPWSSSGWQLLGEAQFHQRKLGAARRSFHKALAKDPADWSIWLDLAVTSKGTERRRAFAEARRLNPFSPELAAYKPAGRKR